MAAVNGTPLAIAAGMAANKDGNDHPLVSSRSPSYERAQHEHDHPSPAPDPELIAALNHLVELEHEAQAAAVAAAGRIQERGEHDDPKLWGQRHEQALTRLNKHVTELGASPPSDSSGRSLPYEATDFAYRDGDEAVRGAAAENMAALSAAYDRAIANQHVTGDSRQLLVELRDRYRNHGA